MTASDLNTQEEDMLATILEQLEDGGTADEGSGVNEQMRFMEQCLLASDKSLKTINEAHSKYQKDWRYSTSFTTDEENSSTADFLNRIHLREDMDFENCDNSFLSTPCVDKAFSNLSTFERSQLLWSFKLSKMLYTAETVDDSDTEVKNYSFQAEVPLVFEKMAAEDMSDYRQNKSVSYSQPNSKEAAEEGVIFVSNSGKNFGRPQVGYGVKSFEWTYLGGNPETIRNDIDATLVLEFQNFDQLNKARRYEDEEGEEYAYSLLDLLGYGPTSPKLQDPGKVGVDEYHPSLVEIKAVVGWDCWSKNYDLKEKLRGQKTTLFLTMIDHDFNISQLGTFTLTLSYRARLESSLSNIRANVALPAKSDEVDKIKVLDKGIALAIKSCNDSGLKKLKIERGKQVESAIYKSNQSFLTEFLGVLRKDSGRDPQNKGQTLEGKIYDQRRRNIWKATYTNIALDPEAGADTSGYSYDGPEIQQIQDEEMEDLQSDIEGAQTDENFTDRAFTLGKTHTVFYVLLGELLEVMMDRALSKGAFLADGDESGAFGSASKIKLMLGPYRLRGSDGTIITGSIGDIPVSLQAFFNFWYRNVIQHDREVYNIMEFIRDLGDQLIEKSLGEDCGLGLGSFKGRTDLKTGFITIPEKKDSPGDPLHDLADEAYDKVTGGITVENMPLLVDQEFLSTTDPSKVYDYIVLYLDNIDSIENFKGDELEDMERGIYHLKIHQGILQSIDFEKTDQPYLRESRFQRLSENPLVYLSNVYKVRASMVGNMLFYPGQMVYVNPIGFGSSLGDPMHGGDADNSPSMSNVMGLGGYHVIISVSHKISKDFTTQITAQWDNNGSSRPRNRLVLPAGCSPKPEED